MKSSRTWCPAWPGLQSTYTIRLNNRHRLHGHVLSGRYQAQLVEGSGNGYLRTACDYVHLNPVRAGLLKPEERLLAYPWSSMAGYVAAREHRPRWIRVDRLLGEHGLQEDSPCCREQFEQRMERRRTEQSDPEAYEPLRSGWCFGSEAFRKEMRRRAEGSLGGNHAGELHREAADAKAERIIAEELQRSGWSERELLARRKKDPTQLAITARLRRETTLPLKAIAARLVLGTSKSANGKLHAFMKGTPEAANPGQLPIGL
jgi:putative transposase